MINDNYFELRNVRPEDYKGYRLPGYLNAVLPKDLEARICDIGCGYGQVLQGLKEAGYTRACGIDISDEAVGRCLSAGHKVTKIDDLSEFARSSQMKFDFVIMSHVLEHVEKDSIIATLSSVREGLIAPGGSLLVMVPNAQSNTGCYWAYEDFTHTTIFTAGSLYYVLKAAGFQQIEFLDPDCLFDVPPAKKLIRKLLLWIYIRNITFWNKVTFRSYHAPSPRIFSYEIKALAKNG